MNRKALILLIFCWLFSIISLAQTKLKAGFDPYEYKDLLEITALQVDTPWRSSYLPKVERYKMVYRSPKMALENKWDLWLRDDSVGVISIHATTNTLSSWLENIYAGMVPAEGVLKMDSTHYFHYKLADIPNSYVHIGWLIGITAIGPSVVKKVNEYYSAGIKEYMIVGHSQGAALAYLLRSYLYYCMQIPDDVVFKTYCSAAPKPGNQFYAYDFDFITRDGWAFRIVNTDDWVPEMPFTVQTINDISETSPFKEAKNLFKGVKPLARVIIKSLYNNLTKSGFRYQRKFTKYLGYKAYKFVSKKIKGFEEPQYVQSFEYVPCGSPVILKPTKEYYENYPKGHYGENLFVHHVPDAYMFLLKQEYLQEK
jgi:hypothetical protein